MSRRIAAWEPAPIPEPITFAIVGAGERGRNVYGRWCLANPGLARVVAVAEPIVSRREQMAAEHRIRPDAAASDWRELLAGDRVADAVVIATPDREHAAPAIAALARGYHVILEKPIAPTADELRAVAEAAGRSAGTVTVAHVLRYTPFFSAVRRALDEGLIGELVTIEHAEHIGYWHFAHSFVRGSWRREDASSPMILAKACHDLDLLRWLAGDRCTAVASFGGLRHFLPEAAPPGALDRCWDGERRCPAADECPFDAVRLYVERTADVSGWPTSVITDDPSPAGRMEALARGPYGRCVYRCDNDVADHQVAVLEFANAVRASLTVRGLTADNTRTITLGGTRGDLRGSLDTGEIEIRRFLPGARPRRAGRWDRDDAARAVLREDERIGLRAAPVEVDGHGGGDAAMLSDVVAGLVARRDGLPGTVEDARTSLAVSIESHLMAFAAEASRHQGRVVTLDA